MENKYHCVKKIWDKFTPEGKQIYNSIMEQSEEQELIAHPSHPIMLEEHWRTIRHNFAVISAFTAMSITRNK